MFMSQLLLCRVIKIARYSVVVDPNDVRYSKKEALVVTVKVVP